MGVERGYQKGKSNKVQLLGRSWKEGLEANMFLMKFGAREKA